MAWVVASLGFMGPRSLITTLSPVVLGG